MVNPFGMLQMNSNTMFDLTSADLKVTAEPQNIGQLLAEIILKFEFQSFGTIPGEDTGRHTRSLIKSYGAWPIG